MASNRYYTAIWKDNYDHMWFHLGRCSSCIKEDRTVLLTLHEQQLCGLLDDMDTLQKFKNLRHGECEEIRITVERVE